MSDKDFIILKVLDILGGSVAGRTKLQKLIFLGQEECGLPKAFNYSAYHYGPYSKELMQSLGGLMDKGFVSETIKSYETTESNEVIEYVYSLTDGGKDYLKALESRSRVKISSKTRKKLNELNDLSRGAIIGYVYGHYQDRLQ